MIDVWRLLQLQVTAVTEARTCNCVTVTRWLWDDVFKNLFC